GDSAQQPHSVADARDAAAWVFAVAQPCAGRAYHAVVVEQTERTRARSRGGTGRVVDRVAATRRARVIRAWRADGGRLAGGSGMVVRSQPDALRRTLWHADDGRGGRAAFGAVHACHVVGGVRGFSRRLLGLVRRGQHHNVSGVLPRYGRGRYPCTRW